MPDLVGLDVQNNPIALRNETYRIWKSGSTYYSEKSDGTITSNTDFKTIFQAIIDGIATRSDTTFTEIKLAAGEYLVESAITISAKYNIVIKGAGPGLTKIEASNGLGSSNMLEIKGGVGSSKSLTANAVKKGETVTVSTGDAATFAVNDYVLVRSNASFWGTDPPKKGEVKHIIDVNTGTGVLTFTNPLNDGYLTADSASIIRIDFNRNITLSDLTITKIAGWTGTGGWLQFRFVDNAKLLNVNFDDPVNSFSKTCVLRTCINSSIDNCNMRMAPSIPANDIYGFAIYSACQGVTISNCHAQGNFRHAYAIAVGDTDTDAEGANRDIVINGCTNMGGDLAGFDSHATGEGITFANCVSIGKAGSSNAFDGRAIRSKFIGCHVLDSGLGSGINLDGNAYESEIIGCHIIDSGNNGIQIEEGITDVIISGNVIKNSGDNGINILTGPSDRFIITNNIITDNTSDGIDVTNSDNWIISNNIIKNNGAYGINFSSGNCTNETITDNIFSGNSSGVINNGGQTGNIEGNNQGYSINTTSLLRPEIYKQGSWFAGAATSGTTGLLGGILSAVVVGTGSSSHTIDSTGNYMTWDTGATNNSLSGLYVNAAIMTRIGGAYFRSAIYLNSVSNVRIFAGLVNSAAAPASSADPLNALEGCGLWFDSAVSANFKRMHNDNTGASTVDDTSLAAATATLYPIEIYAVTDSLFRFVFNNTTTDISTNIPASTTTLGFRVYIENTTGASRTFRTYYVTVANNK